MSTPAPRPPRAGGARAPFVLLCTRLSDFASFRDLFRDFKTRDLMPVVRDPPGGTAIHFVKAERSARLGSVQDELLALSEDPRHSLTFHVLEKAGHWLHVDNPSGLVKLMISTL